MQTPPTWLTKLKAAELHRLAVLIGTPCSGTKSAQIQGIRDALTALSNTHDHGQPRARADGDKLSLVSIDMGIRNLAYSHWTADLKLSGANRSAQYSRPLLKAWRKIDISSKTESFGSRRTRVSSTKDFSTNKSDVKVTAEKESFEPIDYASRAYDLIKNILNEHKPSHVIIERQRFRSGGGSAVLEWTIRVGVFEGMLHAVLRSLINERTQNKDLLVESILPTRVNRYWLEGHVTDGMILSKPTEAKTTAKDVKQMKINLVRKFLQFAHETPQSSMLNVDESVSKTTSLFIGIEATNGRIKSTPKTKANNSKQTASEASKLDDLADSLLQGLAWVHWQNNRLMMEANGHDASVSLLDNFGQ